MKFDIRKVRKEYIILLVSIIIIFLVVLFSRDIIRTWHEMNVDMDCVEEKKEAFPPSYIHGYIVVVFKDNVTEKEAMELINRYALSMNGFSYINTVYVTEGSEYKWLCVLEKSELVEYTALDYVLQSFGGV